MRVEQDDAVSDARPLNSVRLQMLHEHRWDRAVAMVPVTGAGSARSLGRGPERALMTSPSGASPVRTLRGTQAEP